MFNCGTLFSLNKCSLHSRQLSLLLYNNKIFSNIVYQGAAFGFSSIAKAAGEQLTNHLPKILPRLYRYQFDPTPKIQQSMASIWQALVPETNKMVISTVNLS